MYVWSFQLVLFETRIENLEKSIAPSVPSRNSKKSKKCPKERRAIIFGDSQDKDSQQETQGNNFCQYHNTCGQTSDESTTLNVLVKRAKQKKGKHFKKKKRYIKHEVYVMVQKQVKKALKKKKKQHTEELCAFEKRSVLKF